MGFEWIVAAALLSGLWWTSGRFDRTAPVRAGLSGATRAAVTTTGQAAASRWRAGHMARLRRTVRRRRQWSKTRAGRAALRVEGLVVVPALSLGRGLAVALPALMAGGRAIPGGWADAYKAERERRSAPGADANQASPRGGAEEQGGGGGTTPRVGARDTSSSPSPTDEGSPAPVGAGAGNDGREPAVAQGDGVEVPNLQVLQKVLEDLVKVLSEHGNVIEWASKLSRGLPEVLAFSPGDRAMAALAGLTEVAPEVEAAPWLDVAQAALSEVTDVVAAAEALAATGAQGSSEQLLATT